MAEDDLDQFIREFEASLAAGSFVKLTLAKPRGAEPDLKNVYVRLVSVRGGARLSFLSRYRTRDVVKNRPAAEAAAAVRELLGARFLSGHLFTLDRDLRIEFNRRGEARLVRHPPTFKEPPPAAHDRKKRRAVEAAGNVYLRALGVTDERGGVRAGAGDKFRQINRFVEIFGDLLAASPLAGRGDISVVDMGSGKGYLTFAVYDFLSRAGVRAEVTGVEARAELVELCNRVAAEAGFERLRFARGLIEDFEPPPTDVLIALHACDTATDDALYKGVRAGASVIITAPCCHKELRPQIESPAPLRPVLRHGILLEREAESVTDALRALLLEAAGYRVKVFEFISTEHTRKNTMIAGVLTPGPKADPAGALRQFRELKEFYGVREQRLEKLLCDVV
ncbi:MAG TPA: SAM-dependent methyltransferase [Pyrinomonadaceae bacterium]|nr:SAM-dependent methyltransferase [Pyrinomonadaceae bacterium]